MSLFIQNKKSLAAQATIEYLILFTVIVTVILVVAMKKTSSVQSTSTNILQQKAVTMDTYASQLDGSNGQ